jgi:hypothetical protein
MMDVSIWMAVPLVLALVPLTVYFWGPAAHTPLPGLNPLWLVFLWFLVAAVAAATGWWAIRRRERPRATTTGMSIMGLRRVHIGESLRTVRGSQVPGVSHSPLGRIRPLLSALLALAMVVLFFCALSWSSAHAYKVEHEATIKSAMTNAQSACILSRPSMTWPSRRCYRRGPPVLLRPRCHQWSHRASRTAGICSDR